TSRDHLCFVHQLPTEDRWIVTIQNTGDRISSGGEFFQVLAIEPACFRVRVEKDRFFVVDTEFVTIVGSVVDARPAQVLSHAAGIAPPVRQTKLDVDVVLRSFSDDFIEMDESVFVPLFGSASKVKTARPICEVGHWFDVIGTALAKRPNAYNFDSGLCG